MYACSQDELEELVCGKSDFSIDMLKTQTVYEGNLGEDTPHVQVTETVTVLSLLS